LVFFFFQAEDGIRDRNVTGVQTCALPISEEDDDGNSASQNNKGQYQKPTKFKPATQAEIGNLKKEIIAFSKLMYEQGRDVQAEQIEQTLNITDYTKLNSEDVKEAVNKLKGWSK